MPGKLHRTRGAARLPGPCLAPSPFEGTEEQEVDPQVCLAIPGCVVEVVDERNRLAKVDVAGVRRTVNIGLFDGDDAVQPGDWVLIHVGFAISKIDEAEARATRALLEGMGAEYEQELAELRASAIE
jgi:hydrogenase expression/formation protein HypC